MYVVKQHHTSLLFELQCQRNKPNAHTYCDISLILKDDVKLYAHKSVLAAQSRYFDRLVTDYKALDLECR